MSSLPLPRSRHYQKIKENWTEEEKARYQKRREQAVGKPGGIKPGPAFTPSWKVAFRDIDPQNPPYTFVRRLGAGANGSVDAVAVTGIDWGDWENSGVPGDFWEGTNIPEGDERNLEAFALKTFRSPKGGRQAEKEAQRHEYDIMRKLSGLSLGEQKHMVKLYDAYSVNDGTTSAQYYLVMSPIANPGNLVVFLNKQQSGDRALLTLMGCLVTGLAILLKAKIRHHDIHPWNILVHEGVPLYTDFGLSYDFENSKQSRTLENARHQSQFAAPEYFEDHFRDSKAEVFALGAVLYEIMAVYLDHSNMLKQRATMSDTRFGILEESTDARWALQEALRDTSDSLSNLWLKIIIGMLDFNLKERYSIDEILDQCEQGGLSVCDDCKRWRDSART